MPTLDIQTPPAVQSILVATDFSPATEAAMNYALTVARRNHAKVYITHVVAEGYMLSGEAQQRVLDDAWREANRIVTDHFIAGRLDGVDHQLLVEQGDVWEKLSQLIDRFKIDFLVIGTRGRGRIGKLLLGSTAETIFRQAPCPVLTVGPNSKVMVPPEGVKKILFATGFSSHSLRAGAYALWLAQRFGANLTLLNVIPEAPGGGDRAHVISESKQRLRELIPKNLELASEPEYLVEFGASADRILAVAEKLNPDLIVLGVRQPTGLARRFKWATAYEVVNHAPCPVLTVRSSNLS